MNIGDKITGTISALAFGGEGILRHEGLVVFIPYVCVGETVTATLTQVKKSFARAKLTGIEKVSKQRIEARCPYFTKCGGCQLQHLPYKEQLNAKADWIKEALTRIGKLDSTQLEPIEGTRAQWEYRRVIKLRLEKHDDLLRLGFVNATSNGIVDVASCSIFADNPDLWQPIRGFIASGLSHIKHISAKLSIFRASKDQVVVHLEAKKHLSNKDANQFASLPHEIKGALFTGRRKTYEFGDTLLSVASNELTLNYTPLSFIQNHAEQSAKIYQEIIDFAHKIKAEHVFDLYCGFGTLSLSLAKRGIEVTGVESNPESIRLAKDNMKRLGIHANFQCADVANFIAQGLATKEPDLVVVNPPRTGLSNEVTAALARNRQDYIVYVSCMPQTLARDLKILCDAGYQIESCKPYDMFPQTTHVETLVILKG